jgi:hypothetical protein
MRYEDLPLVGQGGQLQFYRWYGTYGPHDVTTRLSITSGSNEILVVRRVFLSLRRSSSPSTWNYAVLLCYITTGTSRHDVVVLYALQNEFPVYRFFSEQLNFPLVSGTTMNVQSADFCTGGTLEYFASIFVERFYI